MSAIRVECPECGHRFRTENTGRKPACPECGARVPLDSEPDELEPQRPVWPWIVAGAGGMLAIIVVFIALAWMFTRNRDAREQARVEADAASRAQAEALKAKAPPPAILPAPVPIGKLPEKAPPDKAAPPVPPKAAPEADNVLAVDEKGVATFRPKMSAKAETKEHLELFVLLSEKGGRTLDEKLAAQFFFGDLASTWDPFANAGRSTKSLRGVGTMLSFSDIKGELIRDGKVIRFGSNFDSNSRLSAAVGIVRTTPDGDYQFVKFVTPVSVFETK